MNVSEALAMNKVIRALVDGVTPDASAAAVYLADRAHERLGAGTRGVEVAQLLACPETRPGERCVLSLRHGGRHNWIQADS